MEQTLESQNTQQTEIVALEISMKYFTHDSSPLYPSSLSSSDSFSVDFNCQICKDNKEETVSHLFLDC